jgi:ribonucleoside-diphosphate reductase beta chain
VEFVYFSYTFIRGAGNVALKDRRIVFRPFEYQQANDYFVTQSNSFWLPTEVSMQGDVQDWENKLTDAEKDVVINTLRLFTQAELAVQDNFWNVVPKMFKKPEIVQMSAAFSNMEAIHQWGYSYLNDSLNLPESEFSAFIQEPSMKAKLDFFCKKTKDVPLFLATLAFVEGVSLFSSFAILINFSRFNKLKGLKQIVAFSVRDESLHSEASCWLFKQYVQEYPKELTKESKELIYDMARTVVELEDDFVDRVFKLAPTGIEGLTPDELKTFIRYRANCKLHDLGLPANWKSLGDDQGLDWFNVMVGGVARTDFFSQRNDSYSLGKISFDKIKF